jgi:hypothetical protein
VDLTIEKVVEILVAATQVADRAAEDLIVVAMIQADRQCTKRLAQNVVILAKFLSNRLAIDQCFAVIALRVKTE